MNEQTGGCLCGTVRYRFAEEPIATAHCHCTDCQKATGSGFATVLGLRDGAVEFVGADNIIRYALKADSGQAVTRLFCGICGSQLFTEAENNPGFLWIKAGSLDKPDWLRPTDACWTGSAAPWATPDSALAQHEGNPA